MFNSSPPANPQGLRYPAKSYIHYPPVIPQFSSNHIHAIHPKSLVLHYVRTSLRVLPIHLLIMSTLRLCNTILLSIVSLISTTILLWGRTRRRSKLAVLRSSILLSTISRTVVIASTGVGHWSRILSGATATTHHDASV